MPYSPSPYGTPSADPAATQNTRVSDLAIDMLRRTKGWVKFLSILGFIGSGFMILGAIGIFSMGNTIGGGFGVGIGVIYLAMSALYIYPCVLLWQYGSSINKLMQSRESIDLETALDKQRGFWKFVSIMAIIIISVYLMMILFFIGLGASGLAR